MNHINNKARILTLIREAEDQFAGTGKALLDIEDYVAEYLTANGVIVPPCKVGDVVYRIVKLLVGETTIVKGEVFEITVTNEHWSGIKYRFYFHAKDDKDDEFVRRYYSLWCDFTDFGKTVFLSREEAEAALKGADDEQN